MTDAPPLAPAQHLAATNKTRFPNESASYREARNALLTEEIELRRHIERVGSQRRKLPPEAKSPRTSSLFWRTAPVASPRYSAIRAR